jgi:hypothetical protein
MIAIVRTSFQTDSTANQEVHDALVGTPQSGPGPFRRVNTAVYLATGEPDNAVLRALADLVSVLDQHHSTVDFLSVSLTRVPDDYTWDRNDPARRVAERFLEESRKGSTSSP